MLLGRAPFGRSGEERQAARHDLALHFNIERRTTRTPEGKIDKQKTRYAAVLNDVPRRTDDYGRNAIGLQVSGNQTHGLVADGSVWYQKSYVYIVLPEEI